MILKNPTNNAISVQIDGKQYSVSPKGEVVLPNRHGLYWKSKLHGFMEIISEDEPVPAAPAPEEEEEVVETTDVLEPEIAVDADNGDKVRKVTGSRRPRK